MKSEFEQPDTASKCPPCDSPPGRSSATGTTSQRIKPLVEAASALNLGSTTTSQPSTYAVLEPRFNPLKLRPPIWPMPIKAREWNRIDQRLRAAMISLFEGKRAWPLFLHGEPGSGKSCAGLAVVDWCGHGIYVNMKHLCEGLIDAQQGRVAFEMSGVTENLLWGDWAAANLCVLDEVGLREKASDHHYETLLKALDSRIDAGRPLIVISNVDHVEIAKLYDDRIGSRIASGTVVQVSGDRRLNRGAKSAEVAG